MALLLGSSVGSALGCGTVRAPPGCAEGRGVPPSSVCLGLLQGAAGMLPTRARPSPGWWDRRGAPPALPSPSHCWGGDAGSCSAKPWSFSLKPDYSGSACACVHACVLGRGGGGISQQVLAATPGPSCPSPPRAAALRGSVPRELSRHLPAVMCGQGMWGTAPLGGQEVHAAARLPSPSWCQCERCPGDEGPGGW